MKKPILLTFLLFAISMRCLADTCPKIQEIDRYQPPPGWTFLLLPEQPIENYHFSQAIHSLNGSFYFQKVICRYDICASSGCPAFLLLSQKDYQQPNQPEPPWNHLSMIMWTYTCMPADYNPAHCVFK